MAKMQKSKQMVRMSYIRDTQLHMLDAFFGDNLKCIRINQEIAQIARANAAKLHINQETFMFGSTWYPHPNPDPNSNRTLHEKYRVRVGELVNDTTNEDRAFKAGITSLISNVLSVARHTADLFNIFPKEITSSLPILNAEVFNIGLPLSKEEIAEINLINANNLSIFHRMLMNRLLCAQVQP